MSSYVIAARRTPVAPRGGALCRADPHVMGAAAVQACLADAGIAPAQVDELIAGNALGAGGNPARLVALAAGIPERVAGLSIDRQCASGLDALLLADAMIGAGLADIVLAGGAESYSRRPMRLRTDPDGGPPVPYDRPPFSPWPERDPEMAEAADALGKALGISRTAQDDWAVRSHEKALAARARLRAELAPVPGYALGDDAYSRPLSSAVCQRATPVFGSVTAANAAVAADAAAFCLVVSEAVAKKTGQPALRISAGVTTGGAPEHPGLAPVAAIGRALARARLRPDGICVAEIMEAYAVQAIACVEGAGLAPEITNPGGGALARGHPIGASGAVLAVRLFHELREQSGAGLAAIAAAGGIGTALVLES